MLESDCEKLCDFAFCSHSLSQFHTLSRTHTHKSYSKTTEKNKNIFCSLDFDGENTIWIRYRNKSGKIHDKIWIKTRWTWNLFSIESHLKVMLAFAMEQTNKQNKTRSHIYRHVQMVVPLFFVCALVYLLHHVYGLTHFVEISWHFDLNPPRIHILSTFFSVSSCVALPFYSFRHHSIF